MIVRRFSFLLVSTVAAVSLSCGVGLEDSSGGNADREIKNEKLREEYEAVRGRYEGFIKLTENGERFPVNVFLWTGEVAEAPQPGDLKPGLRVVLRGRMIQTQFIGDSDNLVLTGQYDSGNGRLRLDADSEISKTSTGCRLGGQDPIMISGSVSSGNVRATVYRNGQEWGKLEEMTRTSRDVSSGSILSEEQDYQRLISTYQPVTGTYEGKLKRSVCAGSPREEDFSLWLYVERVQEGVGSNGTPCYVPRLAMRTFRAYQSELADVTYHSINRFSSRSFLPQFTSATSKLNLDFKNNILSGEIFTTGRWGGFEAKRVSDVVVAPGDESILLRQRLERTFALFTGEYRGDVDAYSGRDWPVKLQMYVDEQNVNGIPQPVLLALYKRRDLADDTIGARLMDVTVAMDGCNPSLFMKSEPNGVGNIPGVGLMRYSTEYDGGRMRGELVDHRGPQGIMSLRRR